MHLILRFVCSIALLASSNGQELIVNGKDATAGQFPYAVSIQTRNSHNCGGSIISRDWILTAAHCMVTTDLNAYRILVGTSTLSSGGTYYRVQKFIRHENFASTRTYVTNDVALIKLSRAITFNQNTRSVTLARTTPAAGTRATAIGWGLNENGVIPNRLQYLNVTTVTLEECARRTYPVRPQGPQICAVADVRNSGVCNGDSGSPLLLRNGQQIGIVSWGTRCANGAPSGYTDVAGFRTWISSKMNSN